MREIWLLPNRRIFALGMVFPGVVTLLGLMLIWQKWGWIWGLALSVAGLSFALLIAWQMSVPRMAHRGGELLVYLRFGRPLRLPLEFVECFFLSSGAGQITTARGDLPVRNLVLRIAERATDYQSSGARTTYGSWADGYINFYGIWCEPLDLELVQKLNSKLASVQRPQK